MTEYVRVQGRLYRAGELVVRRAGSTAFVHRWPRATAHEALVAMGAGAGGELVLEALDGGGSVLHGEVAEVVPEVVCGPEEQTFRVTAYVGLRDGAAMVRVRRGERVLWERRLPEQPHITAHLTEVPWRERGSTGEGDDGGPARLVLELSEPADESLARVSVVHQWGERRFATVHVGPPEREIDVPVALLPVGSGAVLL